MGSSAMGASVLAEDPGRRSRPGDDREQRSPTSTDTYDLVVTHQDLTDRARQKTLSAIHVSVDNFMGNPRYSQMVH